MTRSAHDNNHVAKISHNIPINEYKVKDMMDPYLQF